MDFSAIPLGAGATFADPGEGTGDFGGVVHRIPGAVLRPGSVDDVVAALRWAAEHGVEVVARGAGHAMNGQAQVDGGLVLDLRSLRTVREIGEDHVTVEAGALWSEVLAATLPRGLTPPVFTDYLETTVGGTVSVGGIGGMSAHFGAQTDTVLALDVVTGSGDLVTCSATHERELFDAARAGYGRAGVMVSAKIRLIPAPAVSRCYRVRYPGLDTFAADLRKLVDEGRFSYLEGFVGFDESGVLQYTVEAAAFGDTTDAFDDPAMLQGLRCLPGTAEIEETTYAAFLDRLAPSVAGRKETGEWTMPHPWFNAFVPSSAFESFAAAVLAELTPADLQPWGLVLAYPLPTARLSTPLLRLPDEPLVFLFALLLTADPAKSRSLARITERNERLYRLLRKMGGTLYPIGPPDPGEGPA